MTASPIIPPAAAPAPTAADDAAKAGRMLEAYFLRRIMAEVRTTGEGGLLAPGFGGQVFREMLDEALADRMAEGGGVGLADMVQRQLGGEPGGAPALPGSARAVRNAYAATSASASWRPIGAPIESAALPGGKTWDMPVEATRISSGFGKLRLDPSSATGTRTHKGIDMTAPLGTPVHAARGGQVVRAGATTGGFGNLVVIDHGGGVRSFYGHLHSIDVKKGDQVEAGAVLGQVGSTGRSSGPHLHFEVRQDGRSIDPTSDIAGLKIAGPLTNR
ncbi:MAG TPA: peptidoglycan DD-metalloendopeptidase family protein [Kofleriaceae bacterium]|nr:peptidoglycan DD-metalloendopeptidase family protein [Kofleriaceae bacterium]